MRFKVPQNVQREDTIIGPLTLKQMGILGIGGGLTYMIYISLSATYFIEVWLLPVAFTGLLTLAFAFLKIHSLPFYEFLMNLIEYNVLPKKRIWIQGSGIPFISPFQNAEKKKNNKKTEKIEEKQKPNIQEISEILDSAGKKKELKNLIKNGK